MSNIFFLTFVFVKKLFAFILTFLYLGIATGFSTYSHYCMDRYVETTLWQKDRSKCGVCGMDKTKHADKKKCCKEEHKQVKLEKDHQAAEYAFKQLQLFSTIILPTAYAIQPSKAMVCLTEAYPINNAPPDRAYKPIYMLHCTYLI